LAGATDPVRRARWLHFTTLETATPKRLATARHVAPYPGVVAAWVVDQSSATALSGDPPEIEVTVAQRYLEHGTSEANIDLGYLDLVASVAVAPTTDATGMIATGLNVETLSQRLGGGVQVSETGRWDGSTSGCPRERIRLQSRSSVSAATARSVSSSTPAGSSTSKGRSR
jgi:hypothetical protein